MKMMIIKFVLPFALDFVFDLILKALKLAASKTYSDVDDKLVAVLEKESEMIKSDTLKYAKGKI